MDLPHHADVLLPGPHTRAAAGVVGRVVPTGVEGHVPGPHRFQNGLHRALDGKEIHSGAVTAQGEELGLHRQPVRPARQIDLTQLVELHVPVAVVVIALEHLQHGRQGGGAHDGGVLPQGVEYAHTLPQGLVRWPADLVVGGGGDKGVGDDLAVAAGAAHLSQAVLHLLVGRIPPLGGLSPHEGGGDVVVTVEPGHLFGQVGHPAHVAPPGGDGHPVPLHTKAQLFQDADHLILRHIGAQQGVDLVRL